MTLAATERLDMYHTELEDLAREAGREVKMRQAVFPRLVGQGRMTISQARQRTEKMQLIQALLFVVANSPDGLGILASAKHALTVTNDAADSLEQARQATTGTLSEGNPTTRGGERG